MKFGMNLLLWTGELNDQMLPVLEMLKRVGFDGIGFTMTLTVSDLEKQFGKAGLATRT